MRKIGQLAALAAVCLSTHFASAQNHELLEPPAFASANGQLSILMIAKPKPIVLGGLHPTAWVYEVCPRVGVVDACPANASKVSPYGGVRLQLSPGDHLRIRLVNQLPPAPPDAENAAEMEDMLGANPTNLHTHGLIVEPRRAGNGDSTYGDYVYVYGYPAGKLPSMQHAGLDFTDKPIDYDIYVPQNHPSGLFWFHPHTHGLSLNQVSEGMAGVITIGSVDDYVRFNGKERHANIRHLTFKDIQVEKDGMVDDQEDPGFCSADPHPGEAVRNGSCAGLNQTEDDPPAHHAGGKWFFTINGQVYPTITMPRGSGEIWRFINTSGSRAYSLSLRDDKTGRPIPFQVLSIDGVSIDVPSNASMAALKAKFGGKIDPVSCGKGFDRSVCATRLLMTTAGRMEIYVKATGPSDSATLATASVLTGSDGDDWPSANLAHVVFAKGGKDNAASTVEVRGQAGKLQLKNGILGEPPTIKPGSTAFDLAERTRHDPLVEAGATPDCHALAPGHRRRIFFGVPATNPDAFGLGYEELDAQGKPIPGTFRDIEQFDHTSITVCLPLAAGNQATSEQWELVNVAAEDHNFHIHQVKFTVLPQGAPAGDASVMMDTVIVKSAAEGCDGTVDAYRSGACRPVPVSVKIPFTQVGDFVYHCHILEHEDGGMMAHIRVIPNR